MERHGPPARRVRGPFPAQDGRTGAGGPFPAQEGRTGAGGEPARGHLSRSLSGRPDVRQARLRELLACERHARGGNWHINTGNGYYGGLQFSAGTWRAYGGTA
ncbi:transglycosylase family protein, partial [Streptomyces fagopyri]